VLIAWRGGGLVGGRLAMGGKGGGLVGGGLVARGGGERTTGGGEGDGVGEGGGGDETGVGGGEGVGVGGGEGAAVANGGGDAGAVRQRNYQLTEMKSSTLCCKGEGGWLNRSQYQLLVHATKHADSRPAKGDTLRMVLVVKGWWR
jgi:hypothetical protein